jgi:hypothetical protein
MPLDACMRFLAMAGVALSRLDWRLVKRQGDQHEATERKSDQQSKVRRLAMLAWVRSLSDDHTQANEASAVGLS